MSTYDLVADLPLHIEDYHAGGARAARLQRLHAPVDRRAPVRKGEEGVGEDVVYDSVDQAAAQQNGASLPLRGSWTLRSFAEHLATLELFSREPQEEVSRRYRTWAYESAALDLALRQAGEPLDAVLEREPQPLTFVVSLRLGDPPWLEKRPAAWSATRRCASSSTRPPTGMRS